MEEKEIKANEKQLNTVLVNAFITPELFERFMVYVKNKAQGNRSFALRTAIELLVSMSEEGKI